VFGLRANGFECLLFWIMYVFYRVGSMSWKLMLAFALMVMMGCNPNSVPRDGSATDASSGVVDGTGREGIEINWPGGKVKLGDDGVEVQTRGVEVKTKPGVGTEVHAPGVDVQTKAGEGVRVNAPNVDVDVNLAKPKPE